MCIVQGESTDLRKYYESVKDHNRERNTKDREMRIEISDDTMCNRYKSICGTTKPDILYNQCFDDSKRKIITRWRLSSHKLRIETGRYTRPYTERKDRLCLVCNVVEDEVHAIYDCKAHHTIRNTYQHIINLNNRNIKQLLNPTNTSDATKLASFLTDIERNMDDLEMI